MYFQNDDYCKINVTLVSYSEIRTTWCATPVLVRIYATAENHHNPTPNAIKLKLSFQAKNLVV